MFLYSLTQTLTLTLTITKHTEPLFFFRLDGLIKNPNEQVLLTKAQLVQEIYTEGVADLFPHRMCIISEAEWVFWQTVHVKKF